MNPQRIKPGDKVFYIGNRFEELRGRILTIEEIVYNNGVLLEEIPNMIYHANDFAVNHRLDLTPIKKDTGSGWGFD